MRSTCWLNWTTVTTTLPAILSTHPTDSILSGTSLDQTKSTDQDFKPQAKIPFASPSAQRIANPDRLPAESAHALALEPSRKHPQLEDKIAQPLESHRKALAGSGS